MTYTVTRKQIVDAAMSMRGVPFRHQGRSMNGVDCVGILYVILQAVNYPAIIDVEGYRVSPPASVILDTMRANFDEIPLSDAGLGDIYLMRIGGRKPKHASIIVNTTRDIEKGIEPEILHAYGHGGKGKVVVDAFETWRTRCVYAFRLKGLTV